MVVSLWKSIARHDQSAQNKKFAICLQYLEKEVNDEVEFLHADKHQSFYKLALLFLIEVAWHVRSTQNRNLVIFLQYIKKMVSQLLLCSIVMQKNQIFNGGPVMFIVTCFWVAVVKNGCTLLDHGTLKSAIYISRINWWNELFFLHGDTHLGKRNAIFIIIG